MLSVIYAECHLCRVSFMPSVIMLNVVILNVVAPLTKLLNLFLRSFLLYCIFSYFVNAAMSQLFNIIHFCNGDVKDSI